MKDLCIIQLLHVLSDEEQSDVGVDEEASGAEMQDSNWTNSLPAKSTVTVSVSRLGWIKIESNRRTYFMDRQERYRKEKYKTRFPNPSSQAWSQSHLQNKFTGVFPFHLHICTDERVCSDTCKPLKMIEGTKLPSLKHFVPVCNCLLTKSFHVKSSTTWKRTEDFGSRHVCNVRIFPSNDVWLLWYFQLYDFYI